MKAISAILAGVLVLAAGSSQARDYKLGSLQIVQPWSRATPKGASLAAGYMKITNAGTAPDRLIGGSSPIAGRVELHEMTMADGIMRMRPLKDGVELKPGETVEFKPGSFHVMLVDLKAPIEQGKSVKGTLVFEKAGSIDIEYDVVRAGATSAGDRSGSRREQGMQGMRGMSH